MYVKTTDEKFQKPNAQHYVNFHYMFKVYNEHFNEKFAAFIYNSYLRITNKWQCITLKYCGVADILIWQPSGFSPVQEKTMELIQITANKWSAFISYC